MKTELGKSALFSLEKDVHLIKSFRKCRTVVLQGVAALDEEKRR
jgi:hypothetical protein